MDWGKNSKKPGNWFLFWPRKAGASWQEEKQWQNYKRQVCPVFLSPLFLAGKTINFVVGLYNHPRGKTRAKRISKDGGGLGRPKASRPSLRYLMLQLMTHIFDEQMHWEEQG